MQNCIAAKPETEDREYELLQGLSAVDAVAAVLQTPKDKIIRGKHPMTRLGFLKEQFPEATSCGFATKNNACLVVDPTNSSLSAVSSVPGAGVNLIQRRADGNLDILRL